MALAVEKWYELDLLDSVDITKDPEAEVAQLQAQMPKLQTALAEARQWVASAIEPVPAWHPTDDTYDDQYYFLRAWRESTVGPRTAAMKQAQEQLAALQRSDDPGRLIAGWLLSRIHGHLKDLGLELPEARRESAPSSIGGLPLAEIIWQVRNQVQHFNDVRDFKPPVLRVFRSMVAQGPSLFGLTSPPADDTALEQLLKKRSWAPESLQVLGWIDRSAVVAGVRSIVP
ncbi:hypothetical protein [Micromonospora ureilytica]|uniref:hypothetical protein n=1 Tax=Micromonospora ureilytica TaxID=709868 RepID=UPI002E101031|nr:hypothetical protein OHB55_23210 [Micromonospora ureilytica]